MADVEINKPKTEKTSASVTSTLPRFCPTTKLYSKDFSYNTSKLKNPSPRSRPISDEIKKRPSLVEPEKTNLRQSKLTEYKNSEKVRLKNASLTHISPRKYRGLIPIPNKITSNLLGMSPPITRSPSPLKKITPKELKSSNKVKTITLEQAVKKKTKTGSSRSPSPIRRTSASYTRGKHTSTSPGNLKILDKTNVCKRNDGSKQIVSPRTNSPPKRKPSVKASGSLNVESFGKGKLKREVERNIGEMETAVLKQTSQPSFCKTEKSIQPQEKISLDHLKNKVYSGDHKRLSFEKVHLCIEKSLDSSSLAESKRSYLVTYSTENLKKQEEMSLALLKKVSSKGRTNLTKDVDETEDTLDSKDAIRTLSGHKLFLSPSIKLEMEKGEIGCDDFEISELLHETEENFEDSKDVHLYQDDANEYDSEMSTDGETSEHELAERSKSSDATKKHVNSIWKTGEADLLNDVDYRQSVYHPAVSRRQNNSVDQRPKSKSIENHYAYSNKSKDKIVRSRSSQLKNMYASQSYTIEKDDSNSKRLRLNFDRNYGAPIYITATKDVPLYGSITERIRTKKQRLSAAMLRITLKMIRLLALFNLWPGDFCQMLTFQSLRLAR